jgi:hypothetical protein
MRKCPNCGRVNPPTQVFCECGEYLQWELTGSIPGVSAEQISPESSPQASADGDNRRPCPNCEFRNGPDVDFCEHCGQYLRWEVLGSLPRVRATTG